MALDTYSNLQAAAINWLGREGDTSITSVVADGIALLEAKLNRVLRVGPMEATAVGTAVNGLLTLPDDYNAWRRVEASPYGPLEFVTPDWAALSYPDRESGTPAYFTVQGSTLTVYPVYDGEITLDYYATIPALSDSNTTNWLLTSHPDVYLFGTLVELNAFAKNADAAAIWNQRAAAAVEELTSQDRIKRYSGASIRTMGVTP